MSPETDLPPQTECGAERDERIDSSPPPRRREGTTSGLALVVRWGWLMGSHAFLTVDKLDES